MNERKNERIKEWKNEWMNEWRNEWMNEWRNEYHELIYNYTESYYTHKTLCYHNFKTSLLLATLGMKL